jgi:alpha-L-fucosidase 2
MKSSPENIIIQIKHAIASAITAAVMCLASSALHAQPTAPAIVQNKVDWPAFMARQDLVFESLPAAFDCGAFLGNGLLGTMIHRSGPQRVRWEMGRTDVTQHRRDNARLPIGGLVLNTAGKIQSGTLRMDLWNAEVRGNITTDMGTLKFRTLIHTDEEAMILDLETTDGEKTASFEWLPGHGQDTRNQPPGGRPRFNDPLNPPAFTETIDALPVTIQPRHAGGEFATTWKETTMPGGKRRVVLSIADTFPGNAARHNVVATVNKVAAANFDELLSSHRQWWHALYPKSFVSVPDAELEQFYWIQIYKLASASRPDRPPVDLLGPWFRSTGWPRIWWNLNVESLYLPVYTANHLELGESFTHFIDAKRDNFVRNSKDIYGFDDGATVSHTTCNQGLRGDGSCAQDKYINPGDFTWALHNYYLHYRHSMNHAMVTNQDRHAFYPLLCRSINIYLRLLEEGEDGRLHLPEMHAPEYGRDADNNYNLSLLRWGLQTLIALNQRYNLNDPLLPRWRDVLEKLVPYPADENGFRVGRNLPFAKSHRHWSHLLMVHPLHTIDANDPACRDIIRKSILHWLTVDNSREIYGWSRAAAASLYATLGDGDNAILQIHGHMADKRFVRPNTMYIEGDPVIECSVVLARSLQDMLLQSHSDTIRVFPAVPEKWDTTVFHDFLAEGAFLVSASRKNGNTEWVRIKSLAGEPCRIAPSLVGEVKATVPIQRKGDGIYELTLAKGAEAILHVGDQPPAAVVGPVAARHAPDS